MPGGRVTPATAQLPIVIGAIAAVFFTTPLGQQLFGAAAGVSAGLITTTSYGFFSHSQILLPDMLVVACGLAALCAFWAAVTHPPGAGALVAFYAAVALGLAAKGPMGLLPLLVVAVCLLTEEGVRGLRRLGSVLGLLAFAVVTAAWLVPFLIAGSRSFARTVVWEDWLALPLLAVRWAWRERAYRFVFLAWLIPLIVVLLSQNHRARYLLPTYPAAALLLAWWIARHGTDRSRVLPWIATRLIVRRAAAAR
jgi:4-amino-4-deoxy-L-arabinose transferase-like glycosyltransferase